MKRHLLTIPGHAHTIEVRLYDTLEEMRAAVDKGDDCHGCYHPLFNDEERPPIIAHIYLAREYCSVGIVAHELMHFILDAGFALLGEKDEAGDTVVDDTEGICEMMQDLTAQFWRWHYELEGGDE